MPDTHQHGIALESWGPAALMIRTRIPDVSTISRPAFLQSFRRHQVSLGKIRTWLLGGGLKIYRLRGLVVPSLAPSQPAIKRKLGDFQKGQRMTELTLPALVAMANANNALMDGTMGPVRRIIKEHDVVVGLWQDFASPNGVTHSIIKGVAIVRKVAADRASFRGRVTAIKCVCAEQAEALREVLGDQYVLH